MLPRRHILDVWEFINDKNELLPMSTVTLAIDAIKYIEMESKKDHLVEVLEFNEFVCYMYPSLRPRNRSLLFHVISDLLGLLMYGVPKKSKHTLESIEIINYSEKNIEISPIIEVWNNLKEKVYTKKHGVESIIDGFIKKIRIEMDVMERYPFVEDIFFESREYMNEWLPSFSRYYGKQRKTVKNVYERWWSQWFCKEGKEKALLAMIERLYLQAEREYGIRIDKDKLLTTIQLEKDTNRKENEKFSKWYREGVNLLLKI
jgi:hypothetical protein